MEDRWVTDLRMFEAALGIASPWQVRHWTFHQTEGRLDLFIGFQGAATLPCSACGTPDQPYYGRSGLAASGFLGIQDVLARSAPARAVCRVRHSQICEDPVDTL